MHRALLTLLTLLILLILTMTTALGALDQPTIEPYRYGKAAALSLTFDDGWRGQVEDTVAVLEPHGLRGTFFVMPLAMEHRPQNHTSWERLAELLAAGHEVGTHATVKPRLHELDAESLAAIVDGGHQLIVDRLGVEPVCFALPGGTRPTEAVLAAVARQHPFLRNPNVFGARVMAYGELGHRPWKGARERAAIERTIADGGWRIAVIHGIHNGYAAFPEDDGFDQLCRFIASQDQLWVAPMGEVARYRRAVEVAELSVEAVDARSLRVRLSVPEDQRELLTLPLTLRVPGGVGASQDGSELTVVPGDDAMLVEVVPDGRAVLITR